MMKVTADFVFEIYRFVLKGKKITDIMDYIESMEYYEHTVGYKFENDFVDIFLRHHNATKNKINL